jgi:hypothetical protein
MDDALGVGIRIERMSALLKFPTQFLEVVYLAVEDDPDRLILVVDGLVATGKVDDAQATHAYLRLPVGIDALVVGAAMHDQLAHCLGDGRIGQRSFL